MKVKLLTYFGSNVRRIGGDGEAADFVGRRDVLVQFCSRRVSREPGCFTVSRVCTTAIVLLLACVDDGNAIGEKDEGDDILRLRVIRGVALNSVSIETSNRLQSTY